MTLIIISGPNFRLDLSAYYAVPAFFLFQTKIDKIYTIPVFRANQLYSTTYSYTGKFIPI